MTLQGMHGLDYPVSVRVHRSGGKNPRDGSVRPSTQHIIDGCFWSYQRSDTDRGGDAVSSVMELRGPPGADITDTDSLEFGQVTGGAFHPLDLPGMRGRFHIEGRIQWVRSPFTGWEAGFTAEIVEGER